MAGERMKFDAYSADGRYARDVVHEPSVAGVLRVHGYQVYVDRDGAVAEMVTVHAR
jgi:hypothetical protein